MKHSLSQHARQRGISLVEMSIAAVIVAILLIGALMAVQKVQLERQMHKARLEIPVTLTAIARSSTTQANTRNINTQMISLMEAWPPERVSNPGGTNVRVTGPFPGSTEQVFGSYLTAIPRLREQWQGFNYWISNVPARACLPLLQLLVGQGSVAMIRVGEQDAVQPGAGVSAGATTLVAFATNGVPSLITANATTVCSGSGNKQISVLIARQP